MTREEMYERTMQFSVRIVRMVKAMPRGIAEDVIAKQLTKSATSIGANYREACHGKSTADFVSNLKISEGEADETAILAATACQQWHHETIKVTGSHR